ncbi:hypothetical protein B0H14DRAFT_2621960 [Mycena olivaceomarginata]|nr:hypothetical protein B0H14DRAFT_2621960 [Mycena olivaceomarginata]
MPSSSPLFTCCPRPHRQRARRDFYHSHADEANQTDFRIVNVDEGASGRLSEPGLRADDGAIRRARLKVGIVLLGAGVGQNGVIGSRNNDRLHDFASDGTAPAMVVGGAEEHLISGSTDEVLRKAAAKGSSTHLRHFVTSLRNEKSQCTPGTNQRVGTGVEEETDMNGEVQGNLSVSEVA